MPLQFKFFFFLISIKTKTPIFGGYNCDHFEIVMGVSFCYNPKWCFGEGLTFEVNNITSTILMVFLIIPSNVCPPYSSDSNSSPNPTKIQNIQHDEWLRWCHTQMTKIKDLCGGGGGRVYTIKSRSVSLRCPRFLRLDLHSFSPQQLLNSLALFCYQD